MITWASVYTLSRGTEERTEIFNIHIYVWISTIIKMCQKLIQPVVYRPCGCTETKESIVDRDELIEGDCTGVKEVYSRSVSEMANRTNKPNRTFSRSCSVCSSSAPHRTEPNNILVRFVFGSISNIDVLVRFVFGKFELCTLCTA